MRTTSPSTSLSFLSCSELGTILPEIVLGNIGNVSYWDSLVFSPGHYFSRDLPGQDLKEGTIGSGAKRSPPRENMVFCVKVWFSF